MKIFLDTAVFEDIEKANQTGLIDGVTTNPSLILKSGGDPVETIKKISGEFPGTTKEFDKKYGTSKKAPKKDTAPKKVKKDTAPKGEKYNPYPKAPKGSKQATPTNMAPGKP